jgi:hypothetical protein
VTTTQTIILLVEVGIIALGTVLRMIGRPG